MQIMEDTLVSHRTLTNLIVMPPTTKLSHYNHFASNIKGKINVNDSNTSYIQTGLVAVQHDEYTPRMGNLCPNSSQSFTNFCMCQEFIVTKIYFEVSMENQNISKVWYTVNL